MVAWAARGQMVAWAARGQMVAWAARGQMVAWAARGQMVAWAARGQMVAWAARGQMVAWAARGQMVAWVGRCDAVHDSVRPTGCSHMLACARPLCAARASVCAAARRRPQSPVEYVLLTGACCERQSPTTMSVPLRRMHDGSKLFVPDIHTHPRNPHKTLPQTHTRRCPKPAQDVAPNPHKTLT
eukprot:366113-Chlamydomonas_euryale.AAC.18